MLLFLASVPPRHHNHHHFVLRHNLLRIHLHHADGAVDVLVLLWVGLSYPCALSAHDRPQTCFLSPRALVIIAA